ncbi:cytochrome C oxidase subunit IV family protein [Polycladomyces sp. WAk]|uniref:Cytochrome C oxidase subunit IV family protein n=1 Tax=Polycladomyces zharkentensis TaxID=2807616 RepID=A0ABS2WF70_9BACL|nr:cytochrome C oxidase subunit IV family protein [Polycladomyces sp. WAk]
MKPQARLGSQTRADRHESVRKHVWSFVWMLVLTAASFIAVGMKLLPMAIVVPLIVFFACIQVVLQLFTFMHMDQKGHAIPIIFISLGIVIAVVSVIGIQLL